MSILFGLYSDDSRTISKETLLRLASATNRYAPDGTAICVNGQIGMGFQPYHTHRRSYLNELSLKDRHDNLLTFDGRLDNHSDLRKILGIEDSNASDASIVLAAFERWEEDCFPRLVGDWSLALWSPATQSLYLARDHAGTRNLYFEQTEECVRWSTCLETFLVDNTQRDLNKEFAACYLTCQPLGDRTPYTGIKAVPPAHYLKLHHGRIYQTKHWDWMVKEKLLYATDSEYEEHFFSLFKQAVARRTGMEDPVIAQLSGGMDSTSIVSMSDFIRTENGAMPSDLIDTVSYYDDSEPNWDERSYFTAVEAKRGKQGVHIATAYLESALEAPDSTYLMPGATGHTLRAEMQLEEAIGEGRFRAILSGIGGDELLGGPCNPLPELADHLRSGLWEKLFKQGIQWSASEKVPLVRLLSETVGYTASLYFGPFGRNDSFAPWIVEELRETAKHAELVSRNPIGSIPSSIDSAQAWLAILETQPHRFPNTHARYEYRYPLLDRDLVDLVLRVPPEQIRRPGNRRSLLRRAVGTIVIPKVLERRRKAFPSHGLHQFIETQREEIETLFRGSRLCAAGYIDGDCLRKSLSPVGSEALSGCRRPLMRAIELELWLRSGLVSTGPSAEPHKFRMKRTSSEARLVREYETPQ